MMFGKQSHQSFYAKKFSHNLFAVRIIAGILCMEQLLYGLFFSSPGSTAQKIYFASSAVILLFFILSLFLKRSYALKYPKTSAFLEFIFPAVGMSIAVIRLLTYSGILMNIPTIYIAILYGAAVVFLLDYKQSSLLYAAGTTAAVFVVSCCKETASGEPFTADLLVNGLIAWIVSAMNYWRFRKEEEKNQLIEEQNKKLTDMAERDWLTGLYNRRKIDQLISDLEENSRSDSSPLAGSIKDNVKGSMQGSSLCSIFSSVVLFDLDNFKRINDTYGHQTGDQILRELTVLIKRTISSSELCIRWGGEEFLILSDRNGAEWAERFRKIIEENRFVEQIHLTASFGTVPCDEYSSIKELFSTVDQRLYKAKETGRNRVISD